MDQNKRRSLDISKLRFSKSELSTEESLKDITPIQWSGDVISGKKNVNVRLAK